MNKHEINREFRLKVLHVAGCIGWTITIMGIASWLYG